MCVSYYYYKLYAGQALSLSLRRRCQSNFTTLMRMYSVPIRSNNETHFKQVRWHVHFRLSEAHKRSHTHTPERR